MNYTLCLIIYSDFSPTRCDHKFKKGFPQYYRFKAHQKEPAGSVREIQLGKLTYLLILNYHILCIFTNRII